MISLLYSRVGQALLISNLRALFAVPVLEFNNVVFGEPYPDDLGNSISLAKVSYRVNPTECLY